MCIRVRVAGNVRAVAGLFGTTDLDGFRKKKPPAERKAIWWKYLPRNIHNNTRTQLHPRGGGGGGGGADRAGCCHRRLPIVVCTGKAYRQPKTSVCVCCTRCRSRRVSRASIMRPITYPERHPPKTGAHHKQLFGLVCTSTYPMHPAASTIQAGSELACIYSKNHTSH
jgi:hypothetical protein